MQESIIAIFVYPRSQEKSFLISDRVNDKSIRDSFDIFRVSVIWHLEDA